MPTITNQPKNKQCKYPVHGDVLTHIQTAGSMHHQKPSTTITLTLDAEYVDKPTWHVTLVHNNPNERAASVGLSIYISNHQWGKPFAKLITNTLRMAFDKTKKSPFSGIALFNMIQQQNIKVVDNSMFIFPKRCADRIQLLHLHPEKAYYPDELNTYINDVHEHMQPSELKKLFFILNSIDVHSTARFLEKYPIDHLTKKPVLYRK